MRPGPKGHRWQSTPRGVAYGQVGQLAVRVGGYSTSWRATVGRSGKQEGGDQVSSRTPSAARFVRERTDNDHPRAVPSNRSPRRAPHLAPAVGRLSAATAATLRRSSDCGAMKKQKGKKRAPRCIAKRTASLSTLPPTGRQHTPISHKQPSSSTPPMRAAAAAAAAVHPVRGVRWSAARCWCDRHAPARRHHRRCCSCRRGGGGWATARRRGLRGGGTAARGSRQSVMVDGPMGPVSFERVQHATNPTSAWVL